MQRLDRRPHQWVHRADQVLTGTGPFSAQRESPAWRAASATRARTFRGADDKLAIAPLRQRHQPDLARSSAASPCPTPPGSGGLAERWSIAARDMDAPVGLIEEDGIAELSPDMDIARCRSRRQPPRHAAPGRGRDEGASPMVDLADRANGSSR